ncbi:MAG: HDOD domain-containing protein [Bryobacteraceae bacterium]|nr:HDOD domain-containing protein [Bryobacteraceae bacterium]
MSELPVKPERPWALRLLPPFPAVASRILALVNNEDIAAKEIGEIIKLDPTFTAEILRVANSALFGVSGKITTVNFAVSLLGLERVKAMATFIALNSMVKTSMRIAALRRFWVHTVATAVLAEESSRASGAGIDSAYTAGLLHNLGTMGLMAAYPEEYARMLDVSSESGFELLRTERDLFEIDHCAAGAYLAQEWNFPDEIAAAAATHHDEPNGEWNVYSMVQISWRLADALGYAAFPADREWSYDELVARIPGASRSWIGAGVEQARMEVDSRIAGFGG